MEISSSMISMIFASIPAMVILGLRHGLDADHITAIDNLVRLHNATARARFIGTGFSIGHTIAVLAEIVFIILVVGSITSVEVESIAYTGSIIGMVALASIGVLNIVAMRLYGKNWSSMMASKVIARIDNRVNPFLTSMIVGMVFGLGFDTATQISAITLSAITSATLGIQFALILACFFAIGMISIDTLDSMLLRSAFARLMGKNYFKGISYALSATALAVASLVFYETIFNVEVMNEIFGPLLTVSILGVSLILAFIKS
jgi:nickel/cobalt transporter (NiCoT) family protein